MTGVQPYVKASIPLNLEIVYSDTYCGESVHSTCPYGTMPGADCHAFNTIRQKVYREHGAPWYRRVPACLAATKHIDDPPQVKPKTIWEHLLNDG